jgi:hypothetical protein
MTTVEIRDCVGLHAEGHGLPRGCPRAASLHSLCAPRASGRYGAGKPHTSHAQGIQESGPGPNTHRRASTLDSSTYWSLELSGNNACTGVCPNDCRQRSRARGPPQLCGAKPTCKGPVSGEGSRAYHPCYRVVRRWSRRHLRAWRQQLSSTALSRQSARSQCERRNCFVRLWRLQRQRAMPSLKGAHTGT